MYDYKAVVTNVVDGDTIDCQIFLGFDITVVKRVRLARIDAYEKTLRNGQTEEEKQLGIEATNFLKELLENKQIEIKTYKETGKYGRYIAEISFETSNVNDLMVKKGYAQYASY